MVKKIKWTVGLVLALGVILLAFLSLEIGRKKISFKSEGTLATGNITTPAVLYGEFDLYAPYIWWAKEDGLVSLEVWVGSEAKGFFIYKVVPSVASTGAYLTSINDGKNTGAYSLLSNRILISEFDGALAGSRFEGECKPFAQLIPKK